ncbi:MAG: hypothetical protein DMF88_13335 [Acidobacteria bacterium]|nr:MAG: hypothetical protein DMF88_13335 [Acidobacteriota bacterium]
MSGVRCAIQVTCVSRSASGETCSAARSMWYVSSMRASATMSAMFERPVSSSSQLSVRSSKTEQRARSY